MKRLLFVLLTLVLLAGCQSSSSGSSEDTNDQASTDTTVEASITALKGPYIDGTVTIQPVDCDTLKATGSSTTRTINSIGQSSYEGSGCVEVNASGHYLDEITGSQAEGTINLTGYVDLSASTTFSVNTGTTVTQGREYELVTVGGMSLSAAQSQAKDELLSALGLPADSSFNAFHELNFTETTSANANLLLLSAAMQANTSTTGDVADRATTLQADFKDGAVTAANLATLRASAATYTPATVLSNITTWYANRSITANPPSFASLNPYLADSDADGIVDQSDDNSPTAFSFTSATGADKGGSATSGTVTLAGMSASGTTTATTSGSGTWYLNGTAQTATSFSVKNSDTLYATLTHTDWGETLTTTITIDGTATSYSSTSKSPVVSQKIDGGSSYNGSASPVYLAVPINQISGVAVRWFGVKFGCELTSAWIYTGASNPTTLVATGTVRSSSDTTYLSTSTNWTYGSTTTTVPAKQAEVSSPASITTTANTWIVIKPASTGCSLIAGGTAVHNSMKYSSDLSTWTALGGGMVPEAFIAY